MLPCKCSFKKFIFVFIVIVFLQNKIFSACPCTTTAPTNYWTNCNGDGLWTTAGNWSTGAIPVSSDNVIFDGAYCTNSNNNCTFNIAATTTVSTFTINANYTGTITQSTEQRFIVTNGTTINSGTLIGLNSGNVAGRWDFQGAFTLNGGTFRPNTARTNFRNSITINGGTVDPRTGLIRISPAFMATINFNNASGAAVAFYNLEVLDVGASATINFQGSDISFNDFTLSFTGSGSAGIFTLANGNVTINGNFISTTNTGNNITINKSSGGSTGKVILKGNLTYVHTGTNSGGDCTIVFQGSSAQTITKTNSGGGYFCSLDIDNSSGVTLLTNNIGISSDLTITNGTFTLGTLQTNRVSSGGTLTTLANGTLACGGTSGGPEATNNYPANFTTHSHSGTVHFNSASAQTIPASTSSITYKNLILSSSAKTLGSSATISGNLTINSSASFSANNLDMSVGGNWANDNSFTAGTATVTMNGSSLQTISGSATTTFNNLTISNTTSPISVGASTNFNVNGTLTLNSSATLSPNATIIVGGSGTLTGNGKASATRIASTPDFLTQYTISNKTYTNLTIDYSGAGAQTINLLSYGNLSLSTSGTKTFQAGTTNISGSFSISGTATGDVTTNSSTINFNGSTSQTITAFNYYNLTSSSSGARVLASSGTIGIANVFTPGTNSYTITGSTMDFNAGGSQTIPIANYNNLTLSNSGTKTFTSGTTGIAGVISLSGTATADATTNSSTIDYNGSSSQTISAINFYNLSSSSTGARVLASSGSIGVANVFTPGTNSYTIAGSTLDFNGSGSQTIPAFNYNNLTSSGSGSRTLASSGSIGVAGTFTPGTNSFTITGSTIDFNGSGSQTIPAFNYNNLTSSSTGTRILASSGIIGIANTFNPGTNVFTSTGSTFSFNGTGGAQAIPAFTFNHLTIDNSSGVSLSAHVSIKGTLSLTSGIFSTAGQVFTLVSDAMATARIGEIGGGSISGNITIQRYITGNDGWRMIGAPVGYSAAGKGDIEDWNSEFTMSGFTGTEQSTSPFVSVLTYNESVAGVKNQGFETPSNTSDPLVQGQGYMVWIGDALGASISKTIDLTGPAYTGALSLPITYNDDPLVGVADDGWNLLCNLFPSSIDWDVDDGSGWTRTFMDYTKYTWDDAAQNYKFYLKGGGGGSDGSRYIASKQGFWVHADGGGVPVLAMDERVKSSNDVAFLKQTPPGEIILKLIIESQNGYSDETSIRFANGAHSFFEGNADAYKLFSFSSLPPQISSIIDDSVDLCLNTLPDLTETKIIPIRVITPNPGYCNIKISGIENVPSDYCILMEDKLNGSVTDFRSQNSLNFYLSDTPGFIRFSLHLVKSDSISCSEYLTSLSEINNNNPENFIFISYSKGETFVNFDFPSPASVYISVFNITGQKIKEEKNYSAYKNSYSVDLKNFTPGTYFLVASSTKPFLHFASKVVYLGDTFD